MKLCSTSTCTLSVLWERFQISWCGCGFADSTDDQSTEQTPFLSAKEEECATEIEAAVNQAWDFKNNLMTTTIVSCSSVKGQERER